MDEIKTLIIAAIAYISIIFITAIIGNLFWGQDSNIEYVYKTDTVYIHTIDTIDNTDYKTIDSLQSELLVKNIKLERIKEYNKIAAKDNNIKYLRGWINRDLEE